MNGDTTFISKTEYDQSNRETLFSYGSLETGATTEKYTYDERGNRIVELHVSDGFIQRTVIDFDELNRPIKKQEFRP